MTEQRVVWSLAMPACAEVIRAMTGVSFNSGELNEDITQSRQTRDIQTLYLATSPFPLIPFYETFALE